jgi:hypothetical protein
MKAILPENRAALLKRARHPGRRRAPEKLTLRLGNYYQELVVRLGIIQDEKKTDIVKRALDLYASKLEEDLFPELNQELHFPG